jgi:2-hydroxy-4-carboxymuconate semialdehyde hemiacetal dehydrogenase
MKVCVAGEGAFGQKHIEALRNIEGVEIVSLAGGVATETEAMARKYAIPHWTVGLEDSLKMAEVEAVILTTPTPMHAAQGLQCLRAGKHVMIEIPIAWWQWAATRAGSILPTNGSIKKSRREN